MTGINVENTNSAINKIDSLTLLVVDDIKSIVECISDLSNNYSGVDIDFLFHYIVNEIEKIKSITSIFNNYSDVLRIVLDAYSSQEVYVKNKYDIVTFETNIK